MSDKPIPFSAPMVRALIAGTKTQTRRTFPARLQTTYLANELDGMRYWNVSGAVGGVIKLEPDFLRLLHYRVGDRLYVREHWRTGAAFDDVAPRDLSRDAHIAYEADDAKANLTGRFRQGMHMPRWASRITLTVTDVRVQRLQDISEVDALAEGVEVEPYTGLDPRYQGATGFKDYSGGPYAVVPFRTAISSYKTLWESINGAGSWDANPWVAAYTFSRAMGNIDAQ